jgi:uncharacterized protein YukE
MNVEKLSDIQTELYQSNEKLSDLFEKLSKQDRKYSQVLECAGAVHYHIEQAILNIQALIELDEEV